MSARSSSGSTRSHAHDVATVTTDDAALERLRRLCLALPGVTERASHGEPAFFIQDKKQFAMLDDHHHGADRFAVWCAAPPGAQQEALDRDPQRFFMPPYVGARGWLGVRLDHDPDWDEIAQVIEDAYRAVAPKRLIQQLQEGATGTLNTP